MELLWLAAARVEVVFDTILSRPSFVFPHVDVISGNLSGFGGTTARRRDDVLPAELDTRRPQDVVAVGGFELTNTLTAPEHLAEGRTLHPPSPTTQLGPPAAALRLINRAGTSVKPRKSSGSKSGLLSGPKDCECEAE